MLLDETFLKIQANSSTKTSLRPYQIYNNFLLLGMLVTYKTGSFKNASENINQNNIALE